jgi:capsular exopolysaccharide synthesis family protein
MSRNFELLQQAGQESLLAAAGSNPQPTAFRNVPSEPGETVAPVLPEMDEYSREQVSKLVRHLFLLPGAVRAVVLAGVEQGNGGSWMAVHCARVLAAQVGGSVCVVDGNLRTPALHQYFSVENHDHGFSDAIREPGPLRDYARQVPGVPNLWLMSCGSLAGPGGQALLTAEGLRSRIGELRAAFDYVIIDAPPLGLYDDAVALGQVVGGVALVIAESDTRKERARHAVQELVKANVRVLGAVLNKRTFPIPQKIYDRL